MGLLAEGKDYLGGVGLVDPDGESSGWDMEFNEIKFGSMLSLHNVDCEMWVFWWVVRWLSFFFC